MPMINALQLAVRKNLIQMSLIKIVTVMPDFQGTYQQLALIILFFHTVFKNRPGTIPELMQLLITAI
jgi:hypothetical protein